MSGRSTRSSARNASKKRGGVADDSSSVEAIPTTTTTTTTTVAAAAGRDAQAFQDGWSITEHEQLVLAMKQFPEDWNEITTQMATKRTVSEARAHAQQFITSAERDDSVLEEENDAPAAAAARGSPGRITRSSRSRFSGRSVAKDVNPVEAGAVAATAAETETFSSLELIPPKRARTARRTAQRTATTMAVMGVDETVVDELSSAPEAEGLKPINEEPFDAAGLSNAPEVSEMTAATTTSNEGPEDVPMAAEDAVHDAVVKVEEAAEISVMPPEEKTVEAHADEEVVQQVADSEAINSEMVQEAVLQYDVVEKKEITINENDLGESQADEMVVAVDLRVDSNGAGMVVQLDAVDEAMTHNEPMPASAETVITPLHEPDTTDPEKELNEANLEEEVQKFTGDLIADAGTPAPQHGSSSVHGTQHHKQGAETIAPASEPVNDTLGSVNAFDNSATVLTVSGYLQIAHPSDGEHSFAPGERPEELNLAAYVTKSEDVPALPAQNKPMNGDHVTTPTQPPAADDPSLANKPKKWHATSPEPSTDNQSLYTDDDILLPMNDAILARPANQEYVELLKANSVIFHSLPTPEQMWFVRNFCHFLTHVRGRRLVGYHVWSGYRMLAEPIPAVDADFRMDILKRAAFNYHPFWLLGEHDPSNVHNGAPFAHRKQDGNWGPATMSDVRQILASEGPKNLLLLPPRVKIGEAHKPEADQQELDDDDESSRKRMESFQV